MRTNVDLNDRLVEEGFKLCEVKTKKDLVNLALTEFVQNHKKKDLRELFGKVSFSPGYDYKALRRGK